MALELGPALESVLRELVRQVVREELQRAGEPSNSAGDEDEDIVQLAAQRAAKLRRARSKGGAP